MDEETAHLKELIIRDHDHGNDDDDDGDESEKSHKPLPMSMISLARSLGDLQISRSCHKSVDLQCNHITTKSQPTQRVALGWMHTHTQAALTFELFLGNNKNNTAPYISVLSKILTFLALPSEFFVAPQFFGRLLVLLLDAKDLLAISLENRGSFRERRTLSRPRTIGQDHPGMCHKSHSNLDRNTGTKTDCLAWLVNKIAAELKGSSFSQLPTTS